MKASETKPETVGFGASDDAGAHIFTLTMPPGESGLVCLTQDFGYLGYQPGQVHSIWHATIDLEKWEMVGDTARTAFNLRLREKKIKAGSWAKQSTKMDRMLGKEFCVLLWAAEHAETEEQLARICSAWTALKPFERNFFYSMTVAGGGNAQDKDHGWRKAIFYALSSNNGGKK